MVNPQVPVGYNYASAVLAIRKQMTYHEIAEYCGYDSPSSILNIIRGATPTHPAGEAIWVLYREIYGDKPPHNEAQKKGEFT